MTSISGIRVRSFKAIEELEFEPEQLNLITGRNNTGKTSFLQSLNLAFNPGYLSFFEENVDGLINASSEIDLASMDIEFSQAEQAQLADFDRSDAGTKHRKVVLRHPNKEHAINIFTKSLQDILQLNEQYPLRIQRYFESAGIDEKADTLAKELNQTDLTTEFIQDTLEESVNELSGDLLLPEVQRNSMVIEIDEEEYEFIYMGSYYAEFRKHVLSNSMQKIKEQIVSQIFNNLSEKEVKAVDRVLRRSIDTQLAPRFGSARFVEESPEEMSGIKLVKNPVLSSDGVDMSEDQSAVKLDNIEEYIKDRGIIEGLSDLSFNKLVFEENEEKYEVPYSFMGDGFQTLVGILWEIFAEDRKDQVLLLEEPDVHMHPGYIEELLTQLVDICKKDNIQIFMTTHNRDVINGFLSDRIENQHGEYLEDNFKILQLTDPVPRSVDYLSAKEEVNELNIDLRGI